MLTESPDNPLDIVVLDVFHCHKFKFLPAVYLCSRLAFVYRIRTKSASEIVQGVLTLFSVLGNPKKVRVDNRKEFKNNEFLRVMKEMEFLVHFSTVGHHESQGHIERFNDTLIERI